MMSDIPEPKPDEIKGLRDLLIESDQLGQGLLSTINVYPENVLQIIAGCLFIKSLNATRATSILIDHNLLSEAYVILRHQMEAVFILKAIKEDNSFLGKYMKQDILFRKKLGDVITSNPEVFKIDKHRIEEHMKNLKSEVASDSIKKITIQEVARIAKMEDSYNIFYRVASNISHIGVGSLDNYCIFNDDGKVKELTLFPYEKDIAKLYICVIAFILIAIGCTCEILECGELCELERYKRRFDQLAKPYMEAINK